MTSRGATVLITAGTASPAEAATPDGGTTAANEAAVSGSTAPAADTNASANVALPGTNAATTSAPAAMPESNAAPSPPAKPDLEFSTGKPSPVTTPSPQVPDSWHPEAATSGPMCVVYSSADRRVYVYRDSTEIGISNVAAGGVAPQAGDRVYAAQAPASSGGAVQWKLLGSVQPTPAPDAGSVLQQLQLSPDFSQKLQAAITPGTTLVLTDEPVDKQAAAAQALFDTEGQ